MSVNAVLSRVMGGGGRGWAVRSQLPLFMPPVPFSPAAFQPSSFPAAGLTPGGLTAGRGKG